MAETVSIEHVESPGGAGKTAPQLFVLLECDRTAAPATRHVLSEVDAVVLGRGAAGERAFVRSLAGAVRRLELTAPDPAMSQHHARITRLHGRWVMEDRSSKNGVLVNGAKVARAVLADGDLIELGRTFLLFRDAAVPVDGDPDLAAGDLPQPLAGMPTFSGELVGELAALAAIARADVPVLLLGETGTGKEVAARALHVASGRPGAFVAVNCGALPDTLVEAQLFGHKRGAFSGAVADSPGYVRAADRGTLLLDEIGELPAASQAALLRVLQEREVVPVGEALPVAVDARVVAATHVDLDARVASGAFRRDLAARLAGYQLRLPPVAERAEDLGLLVPALLARAGAAGRPFTAAAARAVLRYGWPDNVRELALALAAAVALAQTGAIDAAHLPPVVRAAGAAGPDAARAVADPAAAILSDADRELRDRLVALVEQHAGNVTAIAKEMGKARWQIHRWLRRFAIDHDRYRS